MSEYVNNPLLYFNYKCTNLKKATDKAIRTGIRKGIKELRDLARTNLKSSVKGSTRKNPKYKDTLVSGIRSYSPMRSKKNKAEITAAVKISSNRKTGSGSFRLAILEQGTFKTPHRYATTRKGVKLKKPRYTGSLKAYQFFKKANQVVTESKIQSYIDREMQTALRELNEK